MKRLLIVPFLLSLSLFAGTLSQGSKTVASAATPEALVASSTQVRWVLIQAKSTNTSVLYAGPSPTIPNFELAAGESVQYVPAGTNGFFDLADIYVDVGTNGDGVDFQYEAR